MKRLLAILFLVLGAVLTLALPFALSGCSSSVPPPTTPQILSARDKAEIVVALGTQALDSFQREVERLNQAGLLKPDDATHLASDAAKVRSALDRLKAGAKLAAKEARDALDTAAAAIDLARSLGARLPPVTDQALQLARDLVGEPDAEDVDKPPAPAESPAPAPELEPTPATKDPAAV